MRVFITGASGGIGSAVVAELLAGGHQVVGLARSDASAAIISALGAELLRGDVTDLDLMRKAADDADGVVYLAFSHDFTRMIGDAVGDEFRAVATIGTALVDTGKPLVVASGTPALAGRTSTEDDPFNTEGPMAGRARTGQAVIDLAEQGVRSAVVRLPRSVHDAGGRYGFSSILIQAARQRGVSAFVGDGTQRWPAVHRDDAASLFRLAPRTGRARFGPARGGRRRRPDAGDRRGDRSPPRRVRRVRPRRGLRAARHHVRYRPALLQCLDPTAIRLGANRPKPARRSGDRRLPRVGVRRRWSARRCSAR